MTLHADYENKKWKTIVAAKQALGNVAMIGAQEQTS
jgi:hypothetical protein